MDLHVTHRHCTVTDEENLAASTAAQNFKKYHDGIIRVDVIFDGHVQNECEYSVRVPGHTLVAKESADTFLQAIHIAADKVERQLAKLKGKQQPSRDTVRG